MKSAALKTMFAAAIACAVSLYAVHKPALADSPNDVWEKTLSRISSVKDYQCVLHVFIWDTPTAIKLNPKNDEGKDNREYWYTYKLDMKWKKPGYNLFTVLAADNPGADIATKTIKRAPGSQVVFGFKDNKNLYSKFPKSGDPVMDKQTAKNIFFMPAIAFEGARRIGFNHNIHTMQDYIERYFKSGRVAADTAPLTAKKNFQFDPAKKKLDYDEEKLPGQFIRLTMTPSDPNKNLGVTREVMYINPSTMIPAQIETYEGDRIVMCMYLENFRANIGLENSLWEDFFKNTQIFNPTGGK
jgi:hypothetical protein